MVDRLNKARRSENMSRIRGTDTEPERLVRSFLSGVGIRYRLHVRNLPGRPDIVVARARTAIYVHGCYWHRHVGCPLTTTPKTNTDFWLAKFAGNVERDRRNQAALRDLGWHSEVIWECEIGRPGTLERVAFEILARLDESAPRREIRGTIGPT